MADYTTQLNNLKNAQKQAALADLENTRNTTLSNLQAEEAKINPTYEAKRTQTSNASKVNARNFQEYLANTGRANSGIGAQYEMGRQNSLNRDINALNTAQAQDISDIARRRTDANNAYNTSLAGANAQVEANYIQNLLQQQQQQWENNMALKQFNEQVRQFNLTRQDNLRGFSSGGRSSSGGSSGGNRKKKKLTKSEVANLVGQANGILSGGATSGVASLAKSPKNTNTSKKSNVSTMKALASAIKNTAKNSNSKTKMASGRTAYTDYTKALKSSVGYIKSGSKPISLQTALKKGYIKAYSANGQTVYVPA